MSKHHRSFLLALLLPAVLLVSAFAVVRAQNAGVPAATRWSDAGTWPDKRVPRAGDKVTIPAGTCRSGHVAASDQRPAAGDPAF